jgi:hypothetical protein
MKGATLPLALLCASAAASAIQRRQLTGLFDGPEAKPERIVKAAPRVRPDAIRQQIRYGPFQLPALHKDV